MKIARFQTYHVRPRNLLVRIETDTGLYGWGEATLEGYCRPAAAAVHQLMELIASEDPRRIEHLWQRMYRCGFYRGGPVLCSAISGIEQALWDILGKSLGVPVHVLLGGRVRDRIRMYGQIGSETIEMALEQFRAGRQRGLTAFKLSPWRAIRIIDSPAVIERAVETMAALHEAAGKSQKVEKSKSQNTSGSDVSTCRLLDISADFALDAHGRMSPAMAIRFARALEPFQPLFLEEPCLPENVDTLVTVARATSIPIATGERLYTRWGFRQVLEKQAAAVLQPDPSHVGGILEARKVAAMGEVYYAAIAPHCPLGPVALAACLQLDACLPNFLIQEQITLGEDLLVEPFVLKNGCIDVPERPGLGIQIDEQKLSDLAYDGDWQSPELRHDDGSIADW